MKDYVQKLKYSMVVLLLCMVSYGLLGPLEIFFGNKKDFAFSCWDFFFMFLVGGLIVWLVGSCILALFPKKVNYFLNTLVLATGVASYAQNMFMNVKLSEADGSPMNWDELKDFRVINTIVWVAIFVVFILLAIFVKKYWKTISMCLAGFLSAIQLVAVVSLLVSALTAGKSSDKSLQIVGDNQFKVAKNDNVIVFVLDTFGNTQLENMLAKYPDALNGLEDFTFYNNADCHYYCTFPSMTHMLTGNELDFDAESNEWMKTSWESDRTKNFYSQLKDKKYTCNLYSGDIGYVYGSMDNLEPYFDNVCEREQKVDSVRLTKLMSKMSIYRYVPYIVKPRFEVLSSEFSQVVSLKDGESVIDDNAEFYEALNERKVTVSDDMENALILEHLFGTHKPYTMDENCNEVEEAEVEDTARGLMRIVNEYLNQLKAVGAYDNSTIIITADHGSWYGNDPQPIMFVKQKNEKHEKLQESSAPVSLDDFQATILQVTGGDNKKFGKSIFDYKDGETRERTVFMRSNHDDYPKITGSAFNTYEKYSYKTNKQELLSKMAEGPEKILSATPWE